VAAGVGARFPGRACLRRRVSGDRRRSKSEGLRNVRLLEGPEPDRLLRSEVLRQWAAGWHSRPLSSEGWRPHGTLDLFVLDVQRAIDLCRRVIPVSVVHWDALYPRRGRSMGNLRPEWWTLTESRRSGARARGERHVLGDLARNDPALTPGKGGWAGAASGVETLTLSYQQGVAALFRSGHGSMSSR
jgi:hypothetical protein